MKRGGKLSKVGHARVLRKRREKRLFFFLFEGFIFHVSFGSPKNRLVFLLAFLSEGSCLFELVQKLVITDLEFPFMKLFSLS